MLLAPSGKPCDARGELDRRGWTFHEVHDPLPAMAQLCLLDLELATGQPDGGPVVERLAMVVVEPQDWPQLPAMLTAARRYVPQAALWSYRDGALTELSTTEPARDPPSNDVVPSSGQSASPPPPGNDRAAAEPPQISADEIDMLLDDNRGPDR